MLKFSGFKPWSFLVVLFAFVGNATIMGFDLALGLILPTIIFLQSRQSCTMNRRYELWLLVVGSLFTVAAFRAPAIGIPYFDGYYLWPIKAFVLALIVVFGRKAEWSMSNTIALTILVSALILIGEVVDGRLVSIFGPNMLYRIFGLLLALALMQSFDKSAGAKVILFVIVLFGAYAVMLTGSSGGIFIVSAALGAFFFRSSKMISLLAVVAGIALVTIFSSYGVFSQLEGAPAVLSRFFYKLNTIGSSYRYMSWVDVTSLPFSLVGYNYQDFSASWSYEHRYHHNIILELYAFYGLIGLGCIGVLLVAFLKASPRAIRGDVLAISFFVFLIGSFFSGDLSDNYGVLGLGSGLALQTSRRR